MISQNAFKLGTPYTLLGLGLSKTCGCRGVSLG
ncbi:MAG: hypothetical protein ACI9CF_001725, partial [Candidatus Omnitrophota bacterium]